MSIFARDRGTAVSGYRHSPAVTIRWSTPADAENVEALAQVEEAEVPEAPLLLGFVGDELWVAVSLSTGATICDPFRPSAPVAELVHQWGRQLTVPAARGAKALGRVRLRSPRTAVAR